jgi:hypothetical protein
MLLPPLPAAELPPLPAAELLPLPAAELPGALLLPLLPEVSPLLSGPPVLLCPCWAA